MQIFTNKHRYISSNLNNINRYFLLIGDEIVDEEGLNYPGYIFSVFFYFFLGILQWVPNDALQNYKRFSYTEAPLSNTLLAAPSKKRCKPGSLDGFFKKQRIDSDAGNYNLKSLNHCHNIIKSIKKGLLSWTIAENMRKIVQKNEVFIMKLSARRGLECRILHHWSQTPGRKGSRASSAWRTTVPSASICQLLFNFLLLLQNLLTSLLHRKSCFRNWPIRNKTCLWQPYLLIDRDAISNLYRGPP